MRIRPRPKENPDDTRSKELHQKSIQEEEKKFKLPRKDEHGAELASQQRSMEIISSGKAESVKTEGVAAAQQMTNTNNVILKMVDSMRLGQLGDKQLLEAQLKTDDTIHTSLQGATIRLELTSEGLRVFIEPVAGQKDIAEALIAAHHDSVTKLQESLAAKNITLQHLQVGDLVADLPYEKPLSPSELFSGQQLDQGKREGREQKGQTPERIDPTTKS